MKLLQHTLLTRMLGISLLTLSSTAVLAQETSTSAVGDTMRSDTGVNATYPEDTQVDAGAVAEENVGVPVTNRAASADQELNATERAVPEHNMGNENPGAKDSTDGPAQVDRNQPDMGDSEASNEASRTWSDTKSAFSDGWLEGKLETALLLNDQLETSKIDVEVTNDTALLTGRVPSDVQRDLAEEIANGVEGIASVDNQLEVAEAEQAEASKDRSFSQYIADVSTTAAVKTRLLTNDQVKGMDINVDTYANKVTLSGQVETPEQKALAESLVKESERVDDVVNQLEVAASAS